jgi:hypothetical protein
MMRHPCRAYGAPALSGRRLNAAKAGRSAVQPKIIKKIHSYSLLEQVDCLEKLLL